MSATEEALIKRQGMVVKTEELIQDIECVRQAMAMCIKGADGDASVLGTVFHPDAAMFGHIGEIRRDVPISAFIQGVENSESTLAGEKYKAEIVEIKVTGRAAMVTLIEQDYKGFDFVNYFTLAKFDDEWKIVTKTFTSSNRNST